jgi:hypothetical protein
MRVEFVASDGGQASLTWGQRSIWRPIQALPQSSSSFNFKRVLTLNQGVTVELAALALQRLIERHQSLRTHFIAGEPPQQRVETSGTYEVEVVDLAIADVADAARAAALRLASTAFALETEWPLRVAFVQAEGLVRSIALATSHVATDFFAVELLVAEFRTFVTTAGALPPPLWQPLAQAEFEASPLGLRRSERSLQHWRKHLSLAPERVFAGEPSRGEPIPFQTWTLTSSALVWATQILAERTRTSASTVLLTGSALVLRAVSRRKHAVLKVIAGNRYSPREQALVAPTCNNGLFVCSPEGGDVAAEIVRSHRDAIAAYMSAAYDPDALIELTAQMARQRGAPLDLSAYFNDARLGKEWPGVPSDRMSREEQARLRAESQLALTSSLPEHDMTFCMTVFAPLETDAVAAVTLLADTRCLSADACRRSLLGFEELLCEAALRSVEIDEIPTFIQPRA